MFIKNLKMPNITIDGKEYDLDSLSDQAKEQVVNLQFAQGEVQRLNAKIAVCQTAIAGYSAALKKELNE